MQFSAYKGNSHRTFNYTAFALFCCTDGALLDSKLHYETFWHWIDKYRQKQADSRAPVTVDLPHPIRVKAAPPVLGDFLQPYNVTLEFNEYTRNLCTYDHDAALGTTTLVIDSAHAPPSLQPGYYRASVRVVTRPEFWHSDLASVATQYNYGMSYPSVELLLTLEERVGPLPEPPAPPARKPQRDFPRTLSEFLADFLDTFSFM